MAERTKPITGAAQRDHHPHMVRRGGRGHHGGLRLRAALQQLLQKKHHQLRALKSLQPGHQQHHRRGHRHQCHQLAGAQGGSDHQRIGAQTLDPVAAQAVPDDVEQKQFAVKAALFDMACQQHL